MKNQELDKNLEVWKLHQILIVATEYIEEAFKYLKNDDSKESLEHKQQLANAQQELSFVLIDLQKEMEKQFIKRRGE
jgi:hypothetical protein